MKRLVYWYGVQCEDRGQAYSFVNENQLIKYEEGTQKGYNKMPKKMQNKIAKKQKFSKKEDRLERGQLEIEADMQRDKAERAKWIMHFKEDHEIAEEESTCEDPESKLKSNYEEVKPKRKSGRSKKEENETPKRKAISKPSSSAIPDGVVSSSTSIDVNYEVSSSKRARRAESLQVIALFGCKPDDSQRGADNLIIHSNM
mmetsp:Transcript_35209/g.63359  ORF Transcript_35209/g.63359 Transcript_35209/m.63359 type:complete len:200 (-) Transcript_35209:218-817(-)